MSLAHLVAGMIAIVAPPQPCDMLVPVMATREDVRAAIGPHAELLEDARKALTLDDVRRPESCARFSALPWPLPKLAGPSRFWVRFRADFGDGPAQGWFLFVPFPSFDRLCVHWPLAAGAYATSCVGLDYPAAQRPVEHNRLVFPVPAGADFKQPVYVELESRSPPSFEVELVRAGAFVSEDHKLQFLGGVFNGVLFSTAVYSLLFFVGVRDRASLFYAIHVASLGLAMLGFEGRGRELLWPWLGRSSAQLPMMFLGISLVAGTLYGREFLQTRERAPRFDLALRAAGIVGAALVPVSLVSIRAAHLLSALAGLSFVASMGSAGFALAGQADRAARYLLFGLSGFLIGLIVVSLSVLGILPIPGRVGVAITKAGVVVGAVVMSLGLGRRLRELRAQRDRALAEAAAQQQIALHRAYFDELTQLPNRNRFMVDATKMLAAAVNSGGTLLVAIVDIVRFREVNHTFGAAADQALAEIGRRLRPAPSPGALVAHLGVDEFGLAARMDAGSTDVEGAARRIAEDILASITQPFEIEGKNVRLSATVGLALAPKDGQTVSELMRAGEAAIQAARARGDEPIEIYSASRLEPPSQLMLRSELWKAVAGDELEVFYQPLHDLRSGELAGAEALVRWRHPRLGLLSPGSFIDLAEQSELISQVGERVLRLVCRDLRLWRAEALLPPKVSVNISARDFQRAGFSASVVELLHAEGIEPSRVELELTESRLVANLGATSRCIAMLRRLGIRVSLDDFGTGYSSLSQIRDLPISGLKVDKSFVAALGASPEADAILTTLVTLAAELGLEITAEGVETKWQRDLVRAHGCHLVQGYLYSPAMPFAAMSDYTRRHASGRHAPAATPA